MTITKKMTANMNKTLETWVVFGLTAVLLTTLCLTAPSASAQGVEPLDTRALDAELDRYWKPQVRKPIRTMLFDKADRMELSIFTGVVPNDSFFSYIPLGGRWDFFFSSAFGLEVFGSYWFSIDGDLKDFLKSKGLYAILTEFPQQLQWNAAASLVWNPLHGKLAVFTTKLFHFDFSISLGVGVIGSTLEIPGEAEPVSKIAIAGHLGLGLRFYVSRLVAIRVDYKQFLYGSESCKSLSECSTGVSAPAEFTVGVSFWTN